MYYEKIYILNDIGESPVDKSRLESAGLTLTGMNAPECGLDSKNTLQFNVESFYCILFYTNKIFLHEEYVHRVKDRH